MEETLVLSVRIFEHKDWNMYNTNKNITLKHKSIINDVHH